MRVDHIAYQRATRVAGFGFLLHAAIGIALLIFGMLSKDTTLVLSSFYILTGLLAWVSLIVIFYQHAQERLEALEEDQIGTSRAEGSSVFDVSDDELRVAARRLRLMHKWMIPVVSLFMAALLGGLAWGMLNYLKIINRLSDSAAEITVDFQHTEKIGWALAICLAFTAMSFIFSRFIAGMAKQTAWQNLRGGAAAMVGNALVLLAVSVGIGFRFFENDDVIRGITWGIPIFMCVLALEIAINFVLNLYRPRIPGEVPRPAFDSKLLSFFAAPDNIVRSINDAINYQFGFDITSSWGYQLLLRSFLWLIGLGILVLILLNTMVIVEPYQQAVRLRGGEIIGDVHASGVMWKWPWPIETAEVYPVTRIQDVHLTARRLSPDRGQSEIDLWTGEHRTDVDIKPFLVRSSNEGTALTRPSESPTEITDLITSTDETIDVQTESETEQVSENFSLVDAEIVLKYRIRENGGLRNFLQFVPDTDVRWQRLSMRQLALRDIALNVVTQQFSRMTLDDVIARKRDQIAPQLHLAIQEELDRHQTGVEVVAINIPMLRPHSSSATTFEEMAMSRQARLQRNEEAQRNTTNTYIHLVGDPALIDPLLAEIDIYNELRNKTDEESIQNTREQAARIERLLFQGGGWAAQLIQEAETNRWIELMSKATEASRVQGELVKYHAAPDVYRQRETMKVYMTTLSTVRKYIIGIDPSRLGLDVDLHELNPLLDFSESINTEKGKPINE